MNNRGLYEMLGRVNLEPMASPAMVQKMIRSTRRRINYSPQHRNGSNGYEDKGYAFIQHLLNRDFHLLKKEWLAAKNGGRKYDGIRLELAQLDQMPEQEPGCARAYHEIAEQYAIDVQELVDMFACYAIKDKNYFVSRKTLAQLTENPENVKNEDITVLLSDPNGSLNILEKDNYVFVTLKKELSQGRYGDDVPQILETLSDNLYESSDLITANFHKSGSNIVTPLSRRAEIEGIVKLALLYDFI